jgi:Tol biopolymer transport system component
VFKRGGDETRGLYIISSAGGEPGFLLKGDFETPAWSPDGKYVVAVSREGLERYPGLYKINVETLEIDKLPSRATPYNPDWSPCGEWIVFAQAPNISEPVPDVGLWTVTAEGKDVRRLTATPGADGPCWSSDGKLIAYAITNGDVYNLEVKKGGVKKVTRAKSYEPSWSPDSDAIAFVSARREKKDSIYVIYY